MDKLSPTEKLSERVSASVDASGISLYALANRTGIARTTLRRKLNGHAEWTISELVAVATVVRADVVAWLDGLFEQAAA